MMEELTLHKSLKLAVKTEEIGSRFYERMAKKFSDNKEISDVFSQLAKDEKVHEAQFKKILASAPPEGEGSGTYESDQFARAIAVSEFFRIDEFRKIEDVKTRAEALSAALAFEKSTLLYYQSLKDSLGENTPLDEIIAAEKEHVMRLARILVTNAEFRGIRDSWT